MKKRWERNNACGMTLLALALWVVAAPARAVDWASVKGVDIKLLAPGQASWEWVLTESDHSASPSVRKGANCRECHEGEEEKIGSLIASGKKLEPNPLPGRPGSIKVNVKAAHDQENLYVRLEWRGSPPGGGQKMDPHFQSKVALMFSDGTVKESRIAGCWGACHDDAVHMASAEKGRKITKYLSASRTKITRQGGGENFKPDAEIKTLLANNAFLEVWRAKLNSGQPAVAEDGYVLDKRVKNMAPTITAQSQQADGKWTVVISRRLKSPGPGHLGFENGKTYQFGVAVHDNYAEDRYHHVSFGYTLAIGKGKADIVAKSN
jgi:cytochrome c-type protein NapC